LSTDALTRATEALHKISGDDAHRAAATRIRLRRELEHRASGRRRLTGIGIVLGVLFGGTTAWALATDNAARVWSAIAGEATLPERVATATTATSKRRPLPATTQHAVPRERTWQGPGDEAPSVAPPTTNPATTTVPTIPRSSVPRAKPGAPALALATEPAAPPPGDALYRHAHELHFRGTDTTAAISAWDAYLRATPDGELALEARYNRTLLLIRVGRYREAHAALLPFAHGEVSTSGYRQDESAKLVDRLSRLNDPAASGHDAP